MPDKAGATERKPLNDPRKKFPKTGPADEPKHDVDEFALEDDAVSRNSKVRGGIEVLHIKTDDTFNPYEREPEGRRQDGGKRDLRKLSEHIKLMRELEERKKRDGG